MVVLDRDEFDSLIGKQTLADLPRSDKIRWSMKGVLLTLKMVRKSLVDSKAAPWLGWLVKAMNAVISVATVIVVLVVLALRGLWSAKLVRGVAAVGIIAVTVILLWEKSLHEWWGWVQGWLWPRR